jgi:hypothetical protein
VSVFVPQNINPLKLERMRSFGAVVTLAGADSAASEEAAREYAASTSGCVYVEDGKERAIAEGALPRRANVWSLIRLGFLPKRSADRADHDDDRDGSREVLHVGLPSTRQQILQIARQAFLRQQNRCTPTHHVR